jgi:hypothetical protein
MAEYLDDTVADLVRVRELPASDAPAFGAGLASMYGFPGVMYYEPDIADARAAMRRVYSDHREALEKAHRGRERILTKYSWANAVRDVERACVSVLEECRSVTP